MTIKPIFAFLIAPMLLLSACSSTKCITVECPPKIDLHQYAVVGLVTFSTNGDSDIERMATQRFLHQVQDAQPGTRVIELGSEASVLREVHRKSWDAPALRAVKQAHGVDAVVIGRVDLERVKPEIRVSTLFKSLSAKSDVNAQVTARLIESGTAATMWTDSAKCTTTVASGGFNAHGEGGFSARDPEQAYGNMIDGLVYQVTDDFRPHYVTRRVPKDYVEPATATASARD